MMMNKGPDSTPTQSAEARLQEASDWWSTSIIDIAPGQIAIRGYAIQDLIGQIRFPDMIWLMLRGELPTRAESDVLEAALVPGVDHGPHAPSIAISRMAVSCGLPVNGAMASAINVLDDVHGGAGQQCMALYTEIEAEMAAHSNSESDRESNSKSDHQEAMHLAAAAVLARRRAAGVKIVPGFGHRFHPIDPRTAPLFALVEKAVKAGVVSGRYAAIGQAVETTLKHSKKSLIPMNIDGITAVIFCELGFAPELGRGLFILSRAVGILAHAWEQKQQGVRIKGPMPRDIPFTYTGVARRPFPPKN